MHRVWVLAVLAIGCDKKAPAASAAGSGSAAPIVVVPVDAAPPPPSIDAQSLGPSKRAVLELASGHAVDSSTIANETIVKGCTPPTKIELRQSSFQTAEMCLLVIRRDPGVEHVVDTDFQCTRARLTIVDAACRANGLDITLKVAPSGSESRVACELATEARCKRDVLPDLFDRDLSAYLERVSSALASDDANAVVAMFAADHRKSQLDQLKQSVNDYVHENFGFRSRNIFGRIQKLEATDVVTERDFMHVTGWVILDDGKRVRTRFMVQRAGNGFELTGAVG